MTTALIRPAAEAAFRFLCSLRMEDGRTWGEAAAPFQLEAARAVLDGLRPFAFWTRPRGGSKTFDIGALCIAIMLIQAPDAARLYIVAGDRDQGALVIQSINELVALNPHLQGLLHVSTFKVTVIETGTVLEVLAADAASSWGLRPYFVAVDEIAQWRDTAQSRALYDSIRTSIAKKRGRMVVCTTPGDPGHFARSIRDHAETDPMWELREVPGPVPWMDSKFLAEQKRALTPSRYARLHDGVWAESDDLLAARADLEKCVRLDGDLAPIPGVNYVIGVDLGLKKDRTAIAVCHVEQQQPPGGESTDVIVVDLVRTWQGSRADEVDLPNIQTELESLSKRYNEARVVMDGWQTVQMRQQMRNKGVRVEEAEVTQTQISKRAVLIHGLIRRWELEIPPDTPLIDELARVKLLEPAPGVYRLDHAPGQHDDRAIAVSIAAFRLSERSVAGPRVRDLMAPPTPLVRVELPWRRQWSPDANARAAQVAPSELSGA